MIVTCLLIALLYSLGAAYTDLKTRKIPNKYNLTVFILAIVLKIAFAIASGWGILLDSLYGLLIGFTVLFVPFIFRLSGAGDVKMLSVLGVLVGYKYFLVIFFLTTLIDFSILVMGYTRIAYMVIIEPVPLALKAQSFLAYSKGRRSKKNPYAFPVSLACITTFLLYFFEIIVL